MHRAHLLSSFVSSGSNWYGGSCLLFHLYALAEAVGLTDKLKDMAFACQPMQKRSGHDLMAKNGVPVSKAQVRGENDGDPLIEVRTQLKQQLCSVFGKGNEL